VTRPKPRQSKAATVPAKKVALPMKEYLDLMRKGGATIRDVSKSSGAGMAIVGCGSEPPPAKADQSKSLVGLSDENGNALSERSSDPTRGGGIVIVGGRMAPKAKAKRLKGKKK